MRIRICLFKAINKWIKNTDFFYKRLCKIVFYFLSASEKHFSIILPAARSVFSMLLHIK